MSTTPDAQRQSGSAKQVAEPDASGVALRARGLTKSFGATRALRDCSLDFRAGEVHAILGENGSGKSTLVKILAGVQRPDAGTIGLGATDVRSFASPSAAAGAGIVAVFQEVLVAGPRSVLDNVFLGTDGVFREGVAKPAREARAREVLTELLGREPDLETPVEDLPLSDRQACCIARALVREGSVLILDEATSALDIATRDRLFAVLRKQCARGTAVIFISHRMDEIAEIADRITVMRSGSIVASRVRGEATSQELVDLMVEKDMTAVVTSTEVPVVRSRGEVVLTTRRVQLRPDRDGVDFSLHAGELVGLAGLEGHGQDAFLRALWGGPVAAGEVVRVDDERHTPLTGPRQAARHGVVLVPRERRVEALFPQHSIRSNFALPTIPQDTRFGRFSTRRSQRRFHRYIERLQIKLGHPEDPIETLSGGNQQKVVIARWLAASPCVLLLNDPTRGIDIGAKQDTYKLLADLAAEGLAVVMLSTEIDEHIELMDRVLVFRDHQLAAEISRPDLTRERLIASFFGTEPSGQSEEIHA